MTLTALILVTISTFAHAFWNYLGKRSNPSASFFLAASLAALVCLSPLLVYYRQAVMAIPPNIWGLLIATGVCQSVYYIGLAGAYRHGHLSVAYPLARAMPAFLVAGVSLGLGLGKPINPIGGVGIGVVVLGCLLVPLTDFKSFQFKNYFNLCCALAVLAACGTTGYTIIDSEALRQLRGLPQIGISDVEIAVLFMILETLTTVVVMGGYVFLTAPERTALRAIPLKGWGYAAVTGLIITGTYGLVLAAMAFVTNVSYLAAFRELSIPLGALLGVVLQKEPAPKPKVLGVGVVLIGLLMVGLA
jgi:drug/metabolite transporter (DMT)-like permease